MIIKMIHIFKRTLLTDVCATVNVLKCATQCVTTSCNYVNWCACVISLFCTKRCLIVTMTLQQKLLQISFYMRGKKITSIISFYLDFLTNTLLQTHSFNPILSIHLLLINSYCPFIMYTKINKICLQHYLDPC